MAYSGTCLTDGRYNDANIPVEKGKLTSINAQKAVEYVAYKFGYPMSVHTEFLGSTLGLFFKPSIVSGSETYDGESYTVYSYDRGNFNQLKTISPATITASKGKNSGGYIYTELQLMSDLLNKIIVIAANTTRVSSWPQDGNGIDAALLSQPYDWYILTARRYNLPSKISIFDPMINWNVGPIQHDHKYSTKKRFYPVSRIGNKNGVVFQDETSKRVFMLWFNSIQGCKTSASCFKSTNVMELPGANVAIGTPGAADGTFNLYGATSDGVSRIYYFLVSNTPADKNAAQNGNNFVKAMMYRVDSTTGQVQLSKSYNTWQDTGSDPKLNILKGFHSAGSMAYRKGYSEDFYVYTTCEEKSMRRFGIQCKCPSGNVTIGYKMDEPTPKKMAEAFNGDIGTKTIANGTENYYCKKDSFPNFQNTRPNKRAICLCQSNVPGSISPKKGGVKVINATIGMIISRSMWNGHQGAIAVVFDAETLEFTKHTGQTSGHSFANQLFTSSYEHSKFIGVDLGDNIPRGINLHSFDNLGKHSRVVYNFKTWHAGHAKDIDGKMSAVYTELSAASNRTCYQWSNDNNVYTEITQLVELPNKKGYLVFFAGERRPLDNVQVGSNLNNPRNLGLIRVPADIFFSKNITNDIITYTGDGSSKLERGGFYDFYGRWSGQSNIGILWLTNYGPGPGSNNVKESVTRLKAIQFSTNRTLVLYEIWAPTRYNRTMVMVVDDDGRIVCQPIKLMYDMRLAPTDELVLNEWGNIIGYSGSRKRGNQKGDKLIVFELKLGVIGDRCTSISTATNYAPSPQNSNKKKPTKKTTMSPSPSMSTEAEEEAWVSSGWKKIPISIFSGFSYILIPLMVWIA